MFNLRQFSLSALTLAATVTIATLCSSTAQAAIVGGQVSGTWQYDFDGVGGFNVGDTFTADYTYDDANVTTNDYSNSYYSRYLYSTVPLLSLVLTSGNVNQTFDVSTGYGQLYWYDIQSNPIYGQYESKQTSIYAYNYLATRQNYFYTSNSIGKDYNGTPFTGSFAQAYSYDNATYLYSSGAYTYAPVTFSATTVPTPALLPGLIGLGLGVLRKRRGQVVLEGQEV